MRRWPSELVAATSPQTVANIPQRSTKHFKGESSCWFFLPKVFLEQPFPHLFLLTNVLAESDYEGGRLLGMGLVSQVQDGRKKQKDKNITTNQIRKGGDIGKGFGKQWWDFTDPSSHKMSQSDNWVYIKIFVLFIFGYVKNIHSTATRRKWLDQWCLTRHLSGGGKARRTLSADQWPPSTPPPIQLRVAP